MHESEWAKGITYLQNIKHNFIKQVEIHHVVNSLESFRGVVIVRCPAKQENMTTTQLKTINRQRARILAWILDKTVCSN